MLFLRCLKSCRFFVFVVAFWLQILSNGLTPEPHHAITVSKLTPKFNNDGNDHFIKNDNILCKGWAMPPHIESANDANDANSHMLCSMDRCCRRYRREERKSGSRSYKGFIFGENSQLMRQSLLSDPVPPVVVENMISVLLDLFRPQMTGIGYIKFKADLMHLRHISCSSYHRCLLLKFLLRRYRCIEILLLKLLTTCIHCQNCFREILFGFCKWLNTQMLCSMNVDFSPINIVPYESQRMTINASPISGGHSAIHAGGADLRPHVVSSPSFSDSAQFRFIGSIGETGVHYHESTDLLCKMSLRDLSPFTASDKLRNECRRHFPVTKALWTQKALRKHVESHFCVLCESDVYCFRIVSGSHIHNTNETFGVNPLTPMDDVALITDKLRVNSEFPPIPRSNRTVEDIAYRFCHGLQANQFEEAGCVVCGRLTLKSNLKDSHGIRDNLGILSQTDIVKGEHVKNPMQPILAENCSLVCKECYTAIADGEMPKHALANGLWIGPIPKELQDLTWMEQMCISRVRHNYCVARLAKGSSKLIANAVMFANPTAELCKFLPPPIEELDDIIAVIFTGPCEPHPMDLRRSPFFVRNRKIYEALQWLKINHTDYSDLDMNVAKSTLNRYPTEGIPISMEYEISDTNKIPEATGLDDKDDEDGTVEGPCPFRVHGLTETRYKNMGHQEMKVEAMQYLKNGGKVLGIEHCEEMESIYNNPQLYPKMFPWLFPYGCGGIGCKGAEDLSYVDHIRHLLLYHDKRFQTDPEFPLIVFNHYNIKSSTTGSHLLVNDNRFVEITNRLLSLNPTALDDLSKKFKKKDSNPLPSTEDEKECFRLLNDLDLLAWRVDGSITNKKNQRSEINALIDHWGSPSWYITIAPADIKHPICIYYADKSGKHVFSPDMYSASTRAKLVIDNPVAHARFFHYFVQLFLQEILGLNSEKEGWFGQPVAHYGTVEQQGRTALHLHMVLWLKGAFSPTEIREKLLTPLDDFSVKLVEYLESCFAGDFMTGSQSQVGAMVDRIDQSVECIQTPIHKLPTAPSKNVCECGTCEICKANENWWERYQREVDYILYKSNVHDHELGLPERDKGKGLLGPYCEKNGKCKARFPRPCYSKTGVDIETGHIDMKKNEQWINTVAYIMTYLLRCNTDVTSLLSGTAIKAVIAYITDYISKNPLKTYMVFDTIKAVYTRNKHLLENSNLERSERGRQVINKIVNALMARSEIGAPMASLYLLGNPDHYTEHSFKHLYWQKFVRHVQHDIDSIVLEDDDKEQLEISKVHGKYVGLSAVANYVNRPSEYEQISVYDWVRLHRVQRISSKNLNTGRRRQNKNKDVSISADDLENSDSDWDTHGGENLMSCTSIPVKHYRPLQSHPLYDSHIYHCVKDRTDIVVKFAGGSLPRKDKGDTDYYACCMLTLFKPWRNGLDLKTSSESWQEAFHSFQFSERQLEIMSNSQSKHECRDARDDYAQQIKSMPIDSVVNVTPLNVFVDGDLNELNNQSSMDSFAESFEDDMRLYAPGQYGNHQHNHVLAIKTMLSKLSLDRTVRVTLTELPDVSTHYNLSPAQWQKVINEEKEKKSSFTMNKMSDEAGSKKRKWKTDFSIPEHVRILDNSYLNKNFGMDNAALAALIDRLIQGTKKGNGLNQDQQRAFRIVANHVSLPNQKQLLMYLGGMGGTGKTTVVEQLLALFEERNEWYRFKVVAPTGSAAALLGGDTYHSAIGINERIDEAKLSDVTLGKVRERLKGVEYIFLDEVSMLSCRDLAKISKRLAIVTGRHDLPFGGINMIFAGDFAQLPPVIGSSSNGSAVALYSRPPANGKTENTIDHALGKALWHQVTTVVILRENMRQRTQSVNDARFRRVLEHMRYKNCDASDLQFLESRRAKSKGHGPDLTSPIFRHTAIICGLNIFKDALNEMGAQRFAQDTGESLESFYSIDTLCTTTKDETKGVEKTNNKILRPKMLSKTIKDMLWNLPASSSKELIGGRIDVCLGMPVIVKHNFATELCMTNGQEGKVVGWDSSELGEGKAKLDTLYVELVNPPQNVNLPSLPPNVIPIPCRKHHTYFTLPSGWKLSIYREQVDVLPFFAMTDYASQGKTRKVNIIETSTLGSCQSYYTALSRSSNADNTAIIGEINRELITGGLKSNGHLRQEFRHLEILDEITKLRYNQKLPSWISGNRRSSLIESWYQWRGKNYTPPQLDPSLKWNGENLLEGLDQVNELELECPQLKKDKPLKAKKKSKSKTGSQSKRQTMSGLGLIWDSVNYSCAYDSILTCLNIISSCNDSLQLAMQNVHIPTLRSLCMGFQSVQSEQGQLVPLREQFRDWITGLNSSIFPRYGQIGTAYDEVLNIILKQNTVVYTKHKACSHCGHQRGSVQNNSAIFNADYHTPSSMVNWIEYIRSHISTQFCPICLTENMTSTTTFYEAPPLMVFHLNIRTDIRLSLEFNICVAGHNYKYTLKSIIYFGSHHFTSRSIEGNAIWYHDGITTGSSLVRESIANVDALLVAKDNRRAVGLIYGKLL